MEQVNEAQPQSQPPSQRFYALEQLGELAGTITLISEGLQAYREQVAGLLAGQKKAEAFELYRRWSGSALIWSNRFVRPGLS